MTRFKSIRISLSQNILTAAVSFTLAGLTPSFAQTSSSLVEIESGTAAFEASTNMPGIEAKGKSGALTAHVELSREADKLVLQRIEASVPVNSLATGMTVRDEHMRRYIFTTPDGKEPDLRFVADSGLCGASGSGREFTCQLAGNLTIRVWRGLSPSARMSVNRDRQDRFGPPGTWPSLSVRETASAITTLPPKPKCSGGEALSGYSVRVGAGRQ